jgi:hypothetical protein
MSELKKRPLTWDIRYSVALLMHGEVAEITEEDDVGVGALAVHADAADGVVVDGGAVVLAVRLHVEIRLLLEPEKIDLTQCCNKNELGSML